MRHFALTLSGSIAAVLLILICPSSLQGQQVNSFAWVEESVGLNEKAEATFSLDKSYDNPYDSAEIAVDAMITGPRGESYQMPCFWYQPVSWSEVELGGFANFNAPGEGVWMLRFTPQSVGTWSIQLQVTDETGSRTSGSYTLTTHYSQSKGFIRLDPTDRQGLRFDDGSPYLPLGMNLSWNDHSLTPFYDAYLPEMASNGINWMRHWFVAFSRQSLEWSSAHWSNIYHGVGRYSQEAAAVTDMIVEKAKEHGIYIQIALEQHGKYSTTVNPQWNENPYNEVNGGWISENSSAEFFSDSDAIAAMKKKYRYIVARWGYSQNVFAWELFNEANWIEENDSDFDAVIGEWHKTMSSYLKQIDPYNHLVTTSTTREELEHFADHPDFDILQEHIYKEPIDNEIAALDEEMLDVFEKQVLIGEFGSFISYGTASEPTHEDLWGDHVRQSTWIGTMKRVPNMFWFWSEYIRPYDLFSLYKPISEFWANEDLGRQTSLHVSEFTLTGASPETLDVLQSHGLQSREAAYLYLYDESYGNWAETGPTITGLEVSLTDLPNGTYDLQFYYPSTGESDTVQTLSVDETQSTTIALPDFSKDLAMKITLPSRSFAKWVEANFSASEIEAGIAAASATPANDGVSNLLKFALGIDDPKGFVDPNRLPQLLLNNAGIARYRFATPGGDVTYFVETSSDLETWKTVSVISLPFDLEQTIELLTPQETGLFLRLRVKQD